MSWIRDRKREFYYRRAKEEGYRSRAVYKLIQLDEEFEILDGAKVIVDLGSSPGSWCQYIKRVLPDSKIYAVDIVRMKRIEGVTFLRGDFTDKNFRELVVRRILEECEYVDVILSDMAPKISGISSYDHARSIDLAENVLDFSLKVLRRGGNTLVKVFDGDMLKTTLSKYQSYYSFVKLRKPRASLKNSSEIYIVAKDFRFSMRPSSRSSSTMTSG